MKLNCNNEPGVGRPRRGSGADSASWTAPADSVRPLSSYRNLSCLVLLLACASSRNVNHVSTHGVTGAAGIGLKLGETRRLLRSSQFPGLVAHSSDPARISHFIHSAGSLRLRGGNTVSDPTTPPQAGTGSSAPNSSLDTSITIRKPDIDKRSYRYLKLSNGLQAVLISDPETHSGAAALCVAVGQLDDPPEVQGLAHFCEHMLFLGTKRYPEESNFDAFCASCAGYSNAWTSTDYTLYHFLVSHGKLHDALERFSSFFTCPLFSESGTAREMHAVDSENNKNLQDDDRREYHLLRAASDPSHPMSRFGAGSYKSLHDMPLASGVDVRTALLELHRKERYGSDSDFQT